MSALVALFELDTVAPEWAPLYDDDYLDEELRRAAGESKAGAIAYHAATRCRDCGRLMKHAPRTHDCGGATRQGLFQLCDHCATLDGCDERRDKPAGWPDRHASSWGLPHSAAEHEELARKREDYRARYRQESGGFGA